MTARVNAAAVLWLWMLGANLCALAQPRSATQPPVDRGKSKDALVQAVVTFIEPVKGEVYNRISTQRVTHVYCGPQEWVGKTFVMVPEGGISSLGRPFPSKVQLSGVYIVSDGRFGLSPVAYGTGTTYGIQGIIFETATEQYASALQLAQAVEKVCQTAPERQLTMLRDLVDNASPVIEAWAIRELGARALLGSTSRPNPQARELLVPLLPQITTIPGKLAFDEAMTWQDQTVPPSTQLWRASPERLPLFQTLLQQSTPEDMQLVVQRIQDAVNARSLNGRDAFLLASQVLESPRAPADTQRYVAQSILAPLARDGVYDAEGIFAYLVGLLRGNAPLGARQAVITALYILNLSAEQLQTLTKLQPEITEPTLKTDLTRLLAQRQL